AVIGSDGRGLVDHRGGSVNIGLALYVGLNATASGAYALSNGTLTLSHALASNNTGERIGYAGAGSFNQTGGLNTISGTNLYLGYSNTANGTFSLQGGALLLTAGANEIVGHFGNGTFLQSGGTHTIEGFLQVGCSGSGTGSFTLSGG